MIGQMLAQHRLAFSLVTARMRRAPLALLMMIAVIGVTLSLPAMLYVALENLQRLAGGFQTAPQISLFLAMSAPEDQKKEIDARLDKHDGIATYRFVSRDEAWQKMQQSTGLAEITGGLEQNPLPDAYVIETKTGDPAAIERLQQEIQQWPGVEHAQLDAVWIKRLHGLLELGNKLVLVIAGLLGFALLIITGNSIRLQIATQREEIELSRLIGATDRFIRRPFLYAGTLYGIGGGLSALLILVGAVWLFNESVAELARLYASDFRLLMPTADVSLALVGGSALLGWIGSYVAVNRALADIERY
ncbi:cell division protein FtsX [Methylobacillus sp. MM3]|jgi:cell division transport system permease protein|uniref:permease-like cell division protein FtsX n=1 Tax=Methylobacillus sp. MM3 TaxID=1848039 RepID=UPI0007DE6DA5|nr:permease-like cell division protein FtsX [Methylobacillus sp. MM3]OAJ70185.1 cell division protein FtsX [Methylobacillus sp. MM3]